ncbi:unnamed protein product [Rotaria sp. Silwood2]|nr:unnamed protein product [Rotaria sp. Silwood2]
MRELEEKLRQIEQLYTDRKSEEYSSLILLREEIAKLAEENLTLNPSLNDSLTANVILQSDLQSFKTQLNERQTMLLQGKQLSSSNYRDKESLQTNVRHLIYISLDHTHLKRSSQHRSSRRPVNNARSSTKHAINHSLAITQSPATKHSDEFRSIAKSYFRRCDGVILVYDSTYERSFLNIREWINTITDATLKKVSVMIVANKIDLSDQIRAEGKFFQNYVLQFFFS